MNYLRATFPTTTQQRAKDLSSVENAWLTLWASRWNRVAGWNMDDIVRLIIVRRAVQAGYYNDGIGENEITNLPLTAEWVSGFREWQAKRVEVSELDPYWEQWR